MNGTFFKSTFSGGDQTCVEVAHTRNAVLIRDSKYTGPTPAQPIITVPAEHWQAVLDLALNQESGILNHVLAINVRTDGSATLSSPRGEQLAYDAQEWDAFTKGIADGQFDRR